MTAKEDSVVDGKQIGSEDDLESNERETSKRGKRNKSKKKKKVKKKKSSHDKKRRGSKESNEVEAPSMALLWKIAAAEEHSNQKQLEKFIEHQQQQQQQQQLRLQNQPQFQGAVGNLAGGNFRGESENSFFYNNSAASLAQQNHPEFSRQSIQGSVQSRNKNNKPDGGEEENDEEAVFTVSSHHVSFSSIRTQRVSNTELMLGVEDGYHGGENGEGSDEKELEGVEKEQQKREPDDQGGTWPVLVFKTRRRSTDRLERSQASATTGASRSTRSTMTDLSSAHSSSVVSSSVASRGGKRGENILRIIDGPKLDGGGHDSNDDDDDDSFLGDPNDSFSAVPEQDDALSVGRASFVSRGARQSVVSMESFLDDATLVSTQSSVASKSCLARKKRRGMNRTSSAAEDIREDEEDDDKEEEDADDEKEEDSRKFVQFGSVSIREHERILDVNPSCSTGPPIGLGWRHGPEIVFGHVEDYELVKGGGDPLCTSSPSSSLSGRRGAGGSNGGACFYSPVPPVPLPRMVRERMLLQRGYTQKQLAQAVRSLNKTKNQRRTTINNQNFAVIEEIAESAKRVLLKRWGKEKDSVALEVYKTQGFWPSASGGAPSASGTAAAAGPPGPPSVLVIRS